MGAAALVLPVSGPYVGLWNALALGVQGDDGFVLLCTLQGQEVNLTDQYGMTLVEAIYRGMNWRVRMRGMEFDKLGLLGILQMFGQYDVAGTLSPVLDHIGDRWSKFTQTLLLTAILGDPPAMPTTLTALGAGFAPNSQTENMWTSKVREMPLELVLLPYAVNVGSVAHNLPFTTT